jgi:hypothetical protein
MCLLQQTVNTIWGTLRWKPLPNVCWNANWIPMNIHGCYTSSVLLKLKSGRNIIFCFQEALADDIVTNSLLFFTLPTTLSNKQSVSAYFVSFFGGFIYYTLDFAFFFLLHEIGSFLFMLFICVHTCITSKVSSPPPA